MDHGNQIPNHEGGGGNPPTLRRHAISKILRELQTKPVLREESFDEMGPGWTDTNDPDITIGHYDCIVTVRDHMDRHELWSGYTGPCVGIYSEDSERPVVYVPFPVWRAFFDVIAPFVAAQAGSQFLLTGDDGSHEPNALRAECHTLVARALLREHGDV